MKHPFDELLHVNEFERPDALAERAASYERSDQGRPVAGRRCFLGAAAGAVAGGLISLVGLRSASAVDGRESYNRRVDGRSGDGRRNDGRTGWYDDDRRGGGYGGRQDDDWGRDRRWDDDDDWDGSRRWNDNDWSRRRRYNDWYGDWNRGNRGRYTTYALGEEGGRGYGNRYGNRYRYGNWWYDNNYYGNRWWNRGWY